MFCRGGEFHPLVLQFSLAFKCLFFQWFSCLQTFLIKRGSRKALLALACFFTHLFLPMSKLEILSFPVEVCHTSVSPVFDFLIADLRKNGKCWILPLAYHADTPGIINSFSTSLSTFSCGSCCVTGCLHWRPFALFSSVKPSSVGGVGCFFPVSLVLHMSVLASCCSADLFRVVEHSWFYLFIYFLKWYFFFHRARSNHRTAEMYAACCWGPGDALENSIKSNGVVLLLLCCSS